MTKKKLLKQIEDQLNSRFTEQTANTYLHAITRLLKLHPNAKRFEMGNIENYLRKLEKKDGTGKVSLGFKRVTLAAIKTYYDILLELELIKSHPCKSLMITAKKNTGKNFNSFIDMDDLEELFSLREERYRHIENRNKIIIGLLIYQGITSAELVNLKISEIDLDTEKVKVVGQGKNRNRTFKLRPKQVRLILDYLQFDRPKFKNDRCDKLILSMRGIPMKVDGLNAFITSMQIPFGAKINPLIIRNSVIHHWVNVKKLPIEEVQLMAGHRYISSTQQFIQEDLNKQKEPINNLHDEIFGDMY